MRTASVELLSLAVFVINLDRSPDRLASITARLNEMGLPFIRVRGVDGLTLGPAPWPNVDNHKYARQNGKIASSTEVGCYLSHVAAMRAFLAGSTKYGLILEDDAKPKDDFVATLAAAIANADCWDVLLLYHNHRGAPVVRRQLSAERAIVAYRLPQTGTVAYLINRAAATTYLDRLLPMSLPIDHAFGRTWETGLRLRGLEPLSVGHQTDAPSTIRMGNKIPMQRQLHKMLFRGTTAVRWFAHNAFQRDPISIPGNDTRRGPAV